MGKRGLYKARTRVKVEVPFMHAFPSREWRLRGWAAWEAHMLRLNAHHILGIKRGEFIVMTMEDVWAMKPERIQELMKKALANVPQQPLRAWLSDWFKGTYRYLKKRKVPAHG